MLGLWARAKPPPRSVKAVARVKGVGSFPFWVHGEADAFLSPAIIKTGVWEPLETQLVRRILPHCGAFFDLGANVGWYTALAQRVARPGTQIFAFEPEPRNFVLLKANTSRGAIRANVSRAAVGDHCGSAKLFCSPSNLGDHRLENPDAGEQFVVTPVVTLDSRFGRKRLPPLLAKMDTQGSEARIFRGASKVFSPGRSEDAFILEFWPKGLIEVGESVSDFIGFLRAFPQRPFRIHNGERRLVKTSWDEIEAQVHDSLHPSLGLFADLLLVTPGAPAHTAIAGGPSF